MFKLKSKTSIVSIIGASMGIILTITLMIGKITISEYSIGLASIGTFLATAVGLLAEDSKKQ